MSLLVDIAREHTRILDIGLTPIILLSSAKTQTAIAEERIRVLGDDKGRLLGLEQRTDYLGDGVFRILVDYKGVKEFDV